MGHPRRMTPARFDQILERQYPARYGKHYIPSILATRTEAPSGSRPAMVWFDRIGRYVHTLSTPERAVLSIITYCPNVIDVLEQRMLPYLPAEHPLSSHHLAAGLVLPRFRGTLAIADELGVLDVHPTIHRDADSKRSR